MLRLPEFTYVAAQTVAEAIAALAEHGPAAMVLAGGTDVVPNLKRRQFAPQVLVSLRGIPELRGVRGDGAGGLVIGALTTLAAVAGHPDVRTAYPALAEAAAQVATPLIRNVATLGGNLLVDTRCTYYNQSEEWRNALGHCMKCSSAAPCRVAPGSPRCLAVSASDTAPALIALAARVRLAGPGGVREIPLAELYRNDGIAYATLARGELLTEIRLPPAGGLRSTYLKLRRRGAFDFPILGVAAAVRMAADGTVAGARLVLGAVASAPLDVPEAALLVGAMPDEASIAAVARAAGRLAKPMDNTDLVIAYRRRMVPVFVTRALRRLSGETSAGIPV